MLQLAACQEEPYPYSMANTAINKAPRPGPHHEESHSWVEYFVSHGIVSTVNR